MSTERAILLRYHEIALKGGNRGWFEDRLAINARKLLERALPQKAPIEVERQSGRVLVHAEWDSTSREALSRVFGVSSLSPMRSVETSKEALLQAALEEFQNYAAKNGVPKSFRVLTRRSDKALPETSMEIDHFIGGALHDAFPMMKVDLKNPDFIMGVEIRTGRSYLWTEKHRARGGLPVGTNARCLALLSGGLDSPVAALRTLRRGSPVSFVHFYGVPFVGEEVLTKIEDLAHVINRFQPDPEPLHVIPFGKIQEQIALATQPKMRTILYRRMMVRIACELAQEIRAQALITGESLGQVASQTVENLATINTVAALPILRPLIAYDKDEIIEEAKRWETFDISIRPGVDCCTLFSDRHPAIRASLAQVEEQEARFPVQDLVQEALEKMEIKRLG